jgi:Flp pilus assembly protein TadD
MRNAYPLSLGELMREAQRACEAGEPERAEPLFRQILAANPKDAQAWHMLAIITLRAGRAGEAVESSRRAHHLERRNHLFLNTLGVSCAEAGDLEEAARAFLRALKERPTYAEAHYNLGKLHEKRGAIADAERSYLRARELDPARPDVANNLGALYSRRGDYSKALAFFERARAARPEDADLAVNISVASHGAAGPAAAIDVLQAFSSAHPQAAQVRAELGRRLLAQGRLAEGWREYAWRRGPPREWGPMDGKRVLLLPEQGLGDHLFFLRFAAALRRRAARVAFACPQKLQRLLERASPVDALCEVGCDAADFDLALPLGDLPALVDANGTPVPLEISADEASVARWRERLRVLGPRPYVGVTWRAGGRRDSAAEFQRRGEDPLHKEIPLAEFASVMRGCPGTILVLQRAPLNGEVEAFSKALGKSAHDFSAVNDDLAEMSALLLCIDEYVGVSNTNMHLRAGVGKTARVLVPFPAEFRWMDAAPSSPWFPGFRLYRESQARSWGEALERLARDLTV